MSSELYERRKTRKPRCLGPRRGIAVTVCRTSQRDDFFLADRFDGNDFRPLPFSSAARLPSSTEVCAASSGCIFSVIRKNESSPTLSEICGPFSVWGYGDAEVVSAQWLFVALCCLASNKVSFDVICRKKYGSITAAILVTARRSGVHSWRPISWLTFFLWEDACGEGRSIRHDRIVFLEAAP